MKALHKTYLRRRTIAFLRENSELIEFTSMLALFLFFVALTVIISHQKHEQVKVVTAHAQVITTPTLTPSPTSQPLTDEEYIKSLPHGQLIWQVYGHESTWGKFDSCKAQGKVNGFGYGQNEYGYTCYSSIREVSNHVAGWFLAALKDMNVNQALCYYRYGIHMNDCDYAQYTLGL